MVHDEALQLNEQIRRMPIRELARMLMIDAAQYRPEALALARAEAVHRGFHADLLETELMRIAWSAGPAIMPVARRSSGFLAKDAFGITLLVIFALAALFMPQSGPRLLRKSYWDGVALHAAEIGLKLLLPP